MANERGNGKVALVTGASSGIGLATSHLLLDNGWKVYATARRMNLLEELKGKGAQVMSLDVTDDQSMQDVVKKILDSEGSIDALINNAGYGEYGAIEDVPFEKARYQFEVNVFGLVRMIQLVLPGMREKRTGRIINISSMGGKMAFPMGGWYHATKFSVEAISDSLRIEVAGFGIHVVVIEPGAIKGTEWDTIMRNTMEEASSEGPYAKLALANKNLMLTSYGLPTAGSTRGVAKVILKALTVKRPRARYSSPFHVKIFKLAQWMFSDRTFDTMLKITFWLNGNR